jgi:hypothetical protein
MENDSRTNFDERLEGELDELFAAYREACPAPEPSANFMPELWQKIEARRSVSYSFSRLTQVFLTAAVAICLLLAILQATATTNNTSPFYAKSYVEALEEFNAAESPVYTPVSLYDLGGGNYQ